MSKKKRLIKAPLEVRSDKINTVIYNCRICKNPTGEKQDWRQSDLDPVEVFGTKDPDKWREWTGLCPNCQKAYDSGHLLMYSKTRGVILAPEARLKLEPKFRDKILSIPEKEMDKVIGKRKPSTTTTN